MQTTQNSHRWFDWPAAFLLMAAMLTAATRLVATRWTDQLSIVQTVAFFGVIAGLALGQTRFSARRVFFFALIYGAFIISWQLGSTLGIDILWSDRLSILGTRLGVIIYQVVRKDTVQDSLLFLVLMFALYWGLSVHAGYTLTRHGDAWRVVLPTGLAMFVIHTFDPLISRRAWYLAFYLFLMLVLVARLDFTRRQREWQETRTALPPHLSLDFIRFSILSASVIIIFAWSAPALAKTLPTIQELWSPVRRTWTKTVSNFNNAFASLRSVQPSYSQIYGSSALLGRGTPLTNAQILIARVPLSIPPDVRLYWRARAYDSYENGMWRSTFAQTFAYHPEDADLPEAGAFGRWIGTFEAIGSVPLATLYTPPQPLWISRAGQIEYAQNPDQTVDIVTFRANPTIQPGQVYRIRASVSHPTIAQLRTAGSEYPDWVTQRYLQLPLDITPRTRQLAEFITSDLETPYDKTVAVTEYLRRNITYTMAIEGDPANGQETIDWFLFDLKQGFCNYYATAEVVMLRSLGIPARWSIGYAQGEVIETEAFRGAAANQFTYVIREKDAHAWPEVYFPRIGWVEFEPTSSQPDIQRPADSPENSAAFSMPEHPEGLDLESGLPGQDLRRDQSSAESGMSLATMIYWSLAIIASVVIIVVVTLKLLPFFGLPPASVLFESALTRAGLQPPAALQQLARQAEQDQARKGKAPPLPVLLERALIKIGIRPPHFIHQWAQRSLLPPLAKAYLEINDALDRIGHNPAATDTPAERAAALSRNLPPAEEPAWRLVTEYQIETFGRRPADLLVAQESAAEVRRLSFHVYWRLLLARFQRPMPSRHSTWQRGN